jgi:hypothetical protein
MKRILSTALLTALSTLSTLSGTFHYEFHATPLHSQPWVTKTAPVTGSFDVDDIWVGYGVIEWEDIFNINITIPQGAVITGAQAGFWWVDPTTGAPIGELNGLTSLIRMAKGVGSPYLQDIAISAGPMVIQHPLVTGPIHGFWTVTYIP